MCPPPCKSALERQRDEHSRPVVLYNTNNTPLIKLLTNQPCKVNLPMETERVHLAYLSNQSIIEKVVPLKNEIQIQTIRQKTEGHTCSRDYLLVTVEHQLETCSHPRAHAAMEGLESSPGWGCVTSAPKMIVGTSLTLGILLEIASRRTVFLPPTFTLIFKATFARYCLLILNTCFVRQH
ncbi:hypothetical protein Hanom_Chr08g00723321 [Helianthus anomalus]